MHILRVDSSLSFNFAYLVSVIISLFNVRLDPYVFSYEKDCLNSVLKSRLKA